MAPLCSRDSLTPVPGSSPGWARPRGEQALLGCQGRGGQDETLQTASGTPGPARCACRQPGSPTPVLDGPELVLGARTQHTHKSTAARSRLRKRGNNLVIHPQRMQRAAVGPPGPRLKLTDRDTSVSLGDPRNRHGLRSESLSLNYTDKVMHVLNAQATPSLRRGRGGHARGGGAGLATLLLLGSHRRVTQVSLPHHLLSGMHSTY